MLKLLTSQANSLLIGEFISGALSRAHSWVLSSWASWDRFSGFRPKLERSPRWRVQSRALVQKIIGEISHVLQISPHWRVQIPARVKSARTSSILCSSKIAVSQVVSYARDNSALEKFSPSCASFQTALASSVRWSSTDQIDEFSFVL